MKNFRAKLKVMLTGCLLLSLATTFAQVKWEVASWQRAMGSHRALIQVDEKADMVAVTIPWRRSDSDAEKRNLILVDLLYSDINQSQHIRDCDSGSDP